MVFLGDIIGFFCGFGFGFVVGCVFGKGCIMEGCMWWCGGGVIMVLVV